MPESIAIEVAALIDCENALRVYKHFKDHSRVFTTLEKLFSLLPRLPIALSVRKIKANQTLSFNSNQFFWIFRLKDGI